VAVVDGLSLRISTHVRAWDYPLDPVTATELVADWLNVSTVWIPKPGPGYAEILLDLLDKLGEWSTSCGAPRCRRPLLAPL
jgi:hypothetical protein